MFNTTITIDAKPNWETAYDPKLVGEYISSLDSGFALDRTIEFKPGAIIPVPSPSLHGFLQWVAAKGAN